MRSALFFLASFAAVLPLHTAPRPGDVYREFTYTRRFGELDPGSRREGIDDLRANLMGPRLLQLGGLENVERAEVSVEYWGGHIGTSGQQFRANGGPWHAIAQARNTGGAKPPECFHRTILGRADTEIPVSELRAGMNEFRFTAGPQLCNSYDWGFYWVYSFTVRLYYKADTPHPTGELLLPPGGELGENPTLAAAVRPDGATITAVDFIGNYRDFNWEGDGLFRQWHYITERGAITHHIGTATRAPYAVRWDTTWIPDQDEPIEFAARITDSLGRIAITPAVRATFRRAGRSVRMYTSADVPPSFSVRVGRRKECTFQIDGDVSKARAARLVLSTWSAAHDGEMGLNDAKLVDRIGLVHNYSFDAIPVPPRLLRTGVNRYYVTSKTTEHAPEINWPGPVLLVEYAADAAPAHAAAAPITIDELPDFEGQPGIRIRTPVATYVYHKEGAAFASIVDNAGAEWIGYRPGGRAAGEFRGIPNLGDHFGHPGAHGAVTRIVTATPDRVEILSAAQDGTASLRWIITSDRAAATVTSTQPYWFLYEGTPAGHLDLASAYYVLSDATRRSLAERWSDVSATWIYFADPSSKYALYLASDATAAPWQYWPMDGNMTVFGFGRELTCCGKFLAGTAHFTIGIVENRGFDFIARAVEARR